MEVQRRGSRMKQRTRQGSDDVWTPGMEAFVTNHHGLRAAFVSVLALDRSSRLLRTNEVNQMGDGEDGYESQLHASEGTKDWLTFG